MQVGVLAVQGAFAEHEHVLSELGVSCLELRNAGDLNKPYDALILPGGESTVQGKLLRDSDMFDTIKSQIEGGMPVLATCAGLILLAQHIEGDDTVHLGTLPVTVKRNAYGRQLGSFHTEAELKGIGEVPMTSSVHLMWLRFHLRLMSLQQLMTRSWRLSTATSLPSPSTLSLTATTGSTRHL